MADDLLRRVQMSNAHLVHAAMPTILACVEALPITDGVRAKGLEVDGKPTELTLDNKIVLALVKMVLGNVDDACVRLLREGPRILPIDERQAPTQATNPEHSPA